MFETDFDEISILSQSQIEMASRYLQTYSPPLAKAYVRELVRYFVLSANSAGSVFFPGDEHMDSLWHHLLSDTKEYRSMCHRIRPGYFLDHVPIHFSSYRDQLGKQSAVEEQLSWLVSYVKNFGDFVEGAENILPLLRAISDGLNCPVSQLSAVARSLAAKELVESVHQAEPDGLFKSGSLLLETNAPFLPSEPALALNVLKEFWEIFRRDNLGRDIVMLSPPELFEVYRKSATVGFVLAQHHSALLRLSRALEWQGRHPQLWSSFVNGESTCALATTHLAMVGASSLAGTFDETDQAWRISGRVPWVSGIGFYSHIVFGFHTPLTTVICCLPFEALSNSTASNTRALELEFLSGTCSSMIEFDNFIVSQLNVVTEVARSQQPLQSTPRPYETPHNFSQLGVAEGALDLIDILCATKQHPHNLVIQQKSETLRKILNVLKEQCVNRDEAVLTGATRNVHFERDECIRRSIRLLGLATRGSGIRHGTQAARVLAESFLFDAVIQSPELLREKILSI